MGKILLCVQGKVRDVNNILSIHNVHPQVRGDVMRRLGTLIYQVQEHLDTHRLAYDEAPEEICRVIVHELVHNVLNSSIPIMELAAVEEQRAILEQRTKDLGAQLEQSELQRHTAEDMLERFQKIHDEMLHSYFREVLILRHQLHDCVTVMQRTRWGRMITLQCVPAEVANLVARGASRPASSVIRVAETQSRSKTDETSETAGSASSSSFSAEENVTCAPMDVEESPAGFSPASGDVTPRQGGENLPRNTSAFSIRSVQWRRPLESRQRTTTPPSSMPVSARSTRGRVDRGEDVKMVIRPCVSVATQTAESIWGDAVNAIFDYEQYIRKLTLEGLLGADGNKLAEEINSPGLSDEAARKALAEFLARRALGGLLDKADHSGNGLLSLLDQANSSLLATRLPAVVGRVQARFKDQLEEIRQAVLAQRCQYIEDVDTLRKAFEVTQLRVSRLLAFLGTYAEEVRFITDFIDNPVAFISDCRDEGAHGGDPRYRRVVADYFIDVSKRARTTSVYASRAAVSDKVDTFNVNRRANRKNEFGYWATNEVVLDAKDAFARLQRSSYSVVKRLLRDDDQVHGGQTIGRRGTRGRFFGGEGGRDSAASEAKDQGSEVVASATTEEEDLMLSSLTRKELVKLLVKQRMRRVATRARLNNCMRRLSLRSHDGGEVEVLQDILDEARGRDSQMKCTTTTINKILDLLGVSEGDSERGIAFFKKNLAFSPYLINPTGFIGDDGQEVVLIQVPVSAQHARPLYDSLMDNCTGYILFNEEVIPIAQPLLTGNDYTDSGETGYRSQRPRFLFTGSVVDYTRSVQLARPLVGSADPPNVCWDLSDPPHHKKYIRMPTPEGGRSVHVSTLTIPQMYQPPAEVYRPAPVATLMNRSGNEGTSDEPETKPVRPLQVIPEIKVKNIKYKPPPNRATAPKVGLNSPPKARVLHPEVHEPTAEIKGLLGVESLTLREERKRLFDAERLVHVKESLSSPVPANARLAAAHSLAGKARGRDKSLGGVTTQSFGNIPSANFMRYRLPRLSELGPASGK